MIEQKGMTFDHNFGFYFPLFSSLLKKEGRRKGELIAKIVIKVMPFCAIAEIKSCLFPNPSITHLFYKSCFFPKSLNNLSLFNQSNQFWALSNSLISLSPSHTLISLSLSLFLTHLYLPLSIFAH